MHSRCSNSSKRVRSKPNTEPPATLAVVGAGSWGTALGILLARHGHRVRLWGHEPEVMEEMARRRENPRLLPGVPFPPGLTPLASLEEALRDVDEPLVAVPSHAFVRVLRHLAALRPRLPRLAWATKGLEPGGRRLLHQAAAEILPHASPAVISGPTFAGEVARGLPTAVTVASPDADHARRLAGWLHGDPFRAYTARDLVGVQIGGAAKNVMAIAAGISDGLGFGANARAALITRGLVEITRLGLALGGEPETFMGLAGLGDLVLTCTDDQSRNRRLGLALADGADLDQARADIGQEVEGIAAARDFHHLAQQRGVEMPITTTVYRVLFEGLPPRDGVRELLARHPREEQEPGG